MALQKEKKKTIVENVSGVVKDSSSVAFVNFHGLTMADTNALREALSQSDVRYLVAKKTLVRRALGEHTIQGEVPELTGELALAYRLPALSAQAGDSALLPARGIYDFGKKLAAGTLTLLGGIFEGRYVGREEMTEIATIPPTPILRGQFVNIINSPLQRFTIALDQIARTREG